MAECVTIPVPGGGSVVIDGRRASGSGGWGAVTSHPPARPPRLFSDVPEPSSCPYPDPQQLSAVFQPPTPLPDESVCDLGEETDTP
jgi:hypothetical protein